MFSTATPESFEVWRRGAARFIWWSLEQLLPSPNIVDLVAKYIDRSSEPRFRAVMDAVMDFCVYADTEELPYSSDPLEGKVRCYYNVGFPFCVINLCRLLCCCAGGQ